MAPEAIPDVPQQNDLQRPDVILFDWDNTLIDSWHAIQDAQNHTFAAFGLQPWTLEETRRRVRGSMRDTFPQLFGERWQEAGRIFYERFAERHLETLAPLPGAVEMLAELSAAEITLAVVSNKKGDYLRQEAAKLGWDRWFRRLVGAFDAARDKPSVEPVLLALDGTGVEPSRRVWFVGDADIDLECATNAGCVPILLRQEAPGTTEFCRHPPALHVPDCMTLSMLMRNL